MSRDIRALDHKTACEFFRVPEYQPRPDWKPFAVQKTIIDVYAQTAPGATERVILFGGGFCCGRCGYGIDIRPDGDSCPKCGYKGEPRNPVGKREGE